MEEKSDAYYFIDFLKRRIKVLKPQSPVPGKQYVYGNRHEANTLEMVAQKLEENPYEILTALKQERPSELQRLFDIGPKRAKTIIRYWTLYSQRKA